MIAAGLVALLLAGEPWLEPAMAPFDRACFDPGIVEVAAACEQGDHPADVCAWIPLLEAALGGGAAVVEAGLVDTFSVSPGAASKAVVPLQFFFGPLLTRTGDDCFLHQMHRMRAAVSGPERSTALLEPAGLVLLMASFPVPPEALAMLEVGLGPDGESLMRAGLALAALLERSGHAAELREAIEGGLLTGDWKEPPPLLSDDLPPDDQREMGRIAEILELAASGRSIDARHAVDRLIEEIDDPRLERRMLIRCGTALMFLGALEDAEVVLRLAHGQLEGASDLEERALYAMAARLRAQNLLEIGFFEEAERIRDELCALEPPLSTLIDAMGGVPTRDPEPFEADFDLGRAMDLFLDLDPVEDRDDALAMMRAMHVMVTWPFPTSDDRGTYGHSVIEALAHFGRGDFEALAEAVEQIMAEYPRYNNLALFMVPALALLQRDPERAFGLTSRALDGLERQLRPTRLADVARTFVHHRAAIAYQLGVVAAVQAGHYDEAFRVAERGRSFVLRRQLGDPGRAGRASEPAPAEREIEARIVDRLRTSTLSGDARERAFREFRSARLDRLLRAAPEASPPLPSPVDVNALRQVLRPDETMISTFAAVDRLWVWIVRPDGAALGHTLWTAVEIEAFQSALDAIRWPHMANPSSDPARHLYDHVLGPVAERLPAGGRLLLVPHGSLHAVPWASLRDTDGALLAERFEIAVLPSASVLATWRDPPHDSGDPP